MIKPYFVTIQIKAIEKYFYVILFINMQKLVLGSKLWIKPKNGTI